MKQTEKGTKTKYFLLAIYLSVFTLINWGCWDMLEINQRGFILGIAIDEGKSDELVITYQLALPEIGTEGGSFGKQRNVVTVAKSIQQGISILSSRIDVAPSMGHLKVIVVGEEVARKNLNLVLDFFERNRDSRLQTKVLLTRGKAKDILEVESYRGIPTAMVIAETFGNVTFTDRIVGRSDLRTIGQKIEGNEDSILVRGSAGKEEVKLAGAGVMKRNKLVGWLGEKETMFAGWLLDHIDGGTLTVPIDEGGKGYYSFREMGGNRELVTWISEGHPWARFEIEIEGSITEITSSEEIERSMDNESVERIEKQIERYIKKEALVLISKTQKKWGADIFGIGKSFRRYKPGAWEEVGPLWEEYYRDLPIEVAVDVKIRRLGLKD